MACGLAAIVNIQALATTSGLTNETSTNLPKATARNQQQTILKLETSTAGGERDLQLVGWRVACQFHACNAGNLNGGRRARPTIGGMAGIFIIYGGPDGRIACNGRNPLYFHDLEATKAKNRAVLELSIKCPIAI